MIFLLYDPSILLLLNADNFMSTSPYAEPRMGVFQESVSTFRKGTAISLKQPRLLMRYTRKQPRLS